MIPLRPRAILFDCDGVIADSEGIISLVLAEEITELGWPMTPEEEQRRFQGSTGAMLVQVLEERLGPLPPDWRSRVSGRIRDALAEGLQPVPHVTEAIQAVVSAGLAVACASNSGRAELHRKLARLGLTDVFGPRVFSWEDVPNPKPAPDIYLAAAASCGVAATECVVVEDTVMGARAGLAAGCRVLGYQPDPQHGFAALPAVEVFSDMRQLPALIGLVAA